MKHIEPRLQQRRRREDALARQKLLRNQTLAASRGLVPLPIAGVPAEVMWPQSAADADGAMDEAGTPADDVASADLVEMDTADAGRARRRSSKRGNAGRSNVAGHVLMAAEWMVDVPGDLVHSWYVMPRPAGRRCLVTATNGSTRAQGRSGKPWMFPSTLPNGSRASRVCGGLSACELDCIWCEDEQTYYVVDLIRWKEQLFTQSPAELRLFWLSSKLNEVRAAEASSSNPCRFVALTPLLCTADKLRTAYAGVPPFSAPRDGLLFLHRLALYEAGPSPLLLSWSDASCSARFYDYGSAQMSEALQRSPDKAQSWRTAEIDAAITWAELLHAAEHPPMATDDPAEPVEAHAGARAMARDAAEDVDVLDVS